MTLVALFAMTMGAWADGIPVSLNVTNISWWGDNAANCSDFKIENVLLLSSNNQVVGSATIQAASCNINIEATDVPVNVKINYSWYSSEDEERWGGEIISSVNATQGSQSFDDMLFVNITYSCTVTLPPRFTLNEEKTEATLESMPTYDLDVNYMLVRDMSVQMTAQVGDGTQEQPRYRVKKDGNKFIPADMEMAAVPALFTVNDAIEQKALTQTQDYIVQIYAIDAEGQPTGEAMTFATFTFEPGIYAVKAVAADGSDYDGETALSNTFQLFQGYEVTVPAGEYATFYKDEKLYVDDEDAVLYTIANVTDTEAQLSDAIKVAPAETPLLVYNKSEESKTFLLIPTDETADEVTPAKEFKGSVSSGKLPASSSTADYYALNGYAFVWVKTDDIEVGANKCWLQIGNQPASTRANTRSIVGGGNTTGIDAIENVTIDNEGWYDLQGRKLQAKPNRGGIYIHNGKKVVVRR